MTCMNLPSWEPPPSWRKQRCISVVRFRGEDKEAADGVMLFLEAGTAGTEGL